MFPARTICVGVRVAHPNLRDSQLAQGGTRAMVDWLSVEAVACVTPILWRGGDDGLRLSAQILPGVVAAVFADVEIFLDQDAAVAELGAEVAQAAVAVGAAGFGSDRDRRRIAAAVQQIVAERDGAKMI